MRNITTAMMIVTLTIASHGQTAEPVSSAKSSQGQPFWRAKVMENEPVLFIRNEGKPFATGKLLFMPSAKPTIMAPDLVMKYEEGKDYVWKPGSNMIELTAGTRIPFKTSAEMVPPPGSPNTLMGVLFAEGYFFHDLQVQVSYQHADNWPLQDAPPAQLLTRSLAKLKDKQPFKLVALGDSITSGCNASGAGRETPPHQPAYPQLVANTLQQRFGASVTLTNLARGGTGAGWGLSMVTKVAAEKPDLVILAFGMNHGEPAAGFEAVMRRLRDAVQDASPEADIVLVAPMTGNPCGFPPERFTGYREVLRNLTGPNVALADVTSPWLELLKRKPFSDLSGNNINHPNDFGHRVYAQIICELFPLKSESVQPTVVKSVRLILQKQPSPVVENTGKVFARQVEQRCEAKVVTGGDAPLTVELAVEKGIGAEGYRIEDRKGGGVRIAGNDERGLLYGLGKFLRTSRYDKGGFTPGTWRGTSVPQKPVRGIYFATHFHNFYHDGPTAEIERYVEDISLWGYNALVVWYDMHHFDGASDPKAVAFREHLHKILSAARRSGMDVGLGVIANEAYGNSPQALRADPSGQRGGWYDCAICPNKPGGMNYILDVLGGEFDWAADLSPRYVWIWPYDQGGCGCAQCRPWGCNGFLKAAERVAELARRKLPGTKIILSTWFFNEDEWKGLGKAFTDKKPFADYILTEDAARPMPAKLPMVGFPEISMHETFPWGGFGATPLTGRAQGQWNHVKATSSGGFPYSEGIFEDLTKVVISQFYWNDQPAAETVKEYIAFEFSPDVVADVAGVIKTLEQNHHWRWWPGELEGVKLDLNWFPSRGAKPQADPGAEEAYATMQRVDGLLKPQAKKAWRWRQLYLRALLDAELKTNGGKPNDKCNEAFAELIKLYHAENANPAVRPPLPADASKNPSSPNSGAAKSPPRDSTTVASSEFSADCHAGKACDGVRASQDEKNFWASANRQDTGAWWRRDLGNKLSIEKIRIQFRGFDGRYHFVPKTITFQVSDDGNAWTTVVSKSADVPANNSPYAATMHTYDINAEGRYVRLLFEDGTDDEVGNSKVVELVEVEVVRAVAPVREVRVVLPGETGDRWNRIVTVFTRQVEKRCPAKVVSRGNAPLTVELAVEKGIGAEGYRIDDRPGGGVRIVGNDERGVLYGVGKFLRTSRYDKGGFAPGTWRGTSVPQKPVRGIYFATHFNNFYHDAPIEEVERYVEELGLWGFNTVAFWYDMRYAGKGFDDPDAVHLRARLTRIGQAAKRIGLDVGMFFAANDSYQSAPADIRADAGGMRGAIYPWNVCPSKPEGLKYSLKVLGEEFDWAAPLKPAYIVCWPYDSGGCGCKDCRPWGANGYLKLSEQLAALARVKLPGTKFVLSTWMFDKGEWQNMVAKFAESKPFFDCVMAEPAGGPIPGGVPWMGFPEISMHETFPWGGFGATPLTGRAQGQWNHVKASSSGGFPYSEGIFEDLTKVVISQFYWNDQPAAETVKEYIAFEFSPDVVAEVAGVIKTLEQNHHWRWWPGELEGVKLDLNWFPSRGAKPKADPGAEEAYAAMQRIDGLLMPQAKKSWRWRQLYLRALLDAELKTNGGKPNDKCNEAFAELIKLYHAENANPALRPPLPGDAR